MIRLQSAVSYLYWKEEKAGNPPRKKKVQTVYEISLLYVQDVSLLPPGMTAIAVTCPHCGAPVKTLGAKFCEYCKSAIEPVNVRVWQFVNVKNM